jgi:hypothetical protein
VGRFVSGLVAAVVAVSVAGCSDDDRGVALVEGGEQCVGFTPAGSRLDDRELLDAAVAEWRDQDSGDSSPGPSLDDGAEVCVVYAGESDDGLPRVVMVSDDVGGTKPFVALFEGMEEDDLDVADIDGVRFLGDDAAVVGVGDGLWLVADRVETAALYSGSPASTHEVDLSASRLVDSHELGVVDGRSEGILVADTVERTVLVTPDGDTGAHHVAEVPLGDSPLEPAAVLEAGDGAAVLADAIRTGRGDRHTRPPEFQLLGTARAAGLGTVVASATTSDRGEVSPVLSIGTPADVISVVIGPRFVRDGGEGVEALDAAVGWAAGTMVVDSTGGPIAYVVAGQPPAEVDGRVGLDVRVGRARHALAGPVAVAPADGSATAAVIGTSPTGQVVPTVPAEATVTVDRSGS